MSSLHVLTRQRLYQFTCTINNKQHARPVLINNLFQLGLGHLFMSNLHYLFEYGIYVIMKFNISLYLNIEDKQDKCGLRHLSFLYSKI